MLILKLGCTQLSDVFNVTYLTIQRWLDRWDKLGLPGLYDRKGRGRKPSLNPQQQFQVKKWGKSNLKQLEVVK